MKTGSRRIRSYHSGEIKHWEPKHVWDRKNVDHKEELLLGGEGLVEG